MVQGAGLYPISLPPLFARLFRVMMETVPGKQWTLKDFYGAAYRNAWHYKVRQSDSWKL